MWLHNVNTETIQFQEGLELGVHTQTRGPHTSHNFAIRLHFTKKLTCLEDLQTRDVSTCSGFWVKIPAFFRRRRIDPQEKEQVHLRGIPFYLISPPLRKHWSSGRPEWLGETVVTIWNVLSGDIGPHRGHGGPHAHRSARGTRNVKHTELSLQRENA